MYWTVEYWNGERYVFRGFVIAEDVKLAEKKLDEYRRAVFCRADSFRLAVGLVPINRTVLESRIQSYRVNNNNR